MTRNRQAKRWGSPTHTNTHERGKLNSADVGSLTNRAPNQKETTCMALHRGGSFETHEDNLAVFADEKACHDRCHLDVVFFSSHDAHAKAVTPLPGRSRTQRAKRHNCQTSSYVMDKLSTWLWRRLAYASGALRAGTSWERTIF
jgi:hypothetical protein